MIKIYILIAFYSIIATPQTTIAAPAQVAITNQNKTKYYLSGHELPPKLVHAIIALPSKELKYKAAQNLLKVQPNTWKNIYFSANGDLQFYSQP